MTAWIELARVSNLPTIVSNALVGWALAIGTAPDWRFALATVAAALLYSAGMLFNDVCDATIDARERPGRPIPSGRVSVTAATRAAGVAIAAALLLLGATSHAAAGAGGVLAALIVIYDFTHARSRASVVLMGGCRALVYVMVGAATPPPGGWPLPMPDAAFFAGGLGLYVIGLSLVARGEIGGRPMSRGVQATLALALLGVPLAVASVRWPSAPGWSAAAAGLLAFGVGLGVRHLVAAPSRPGRAVAAWIAAISLVDGFFLTLLDRPGLAAVAAACWLATLIGQRRVTGT